MKTATGSSGGGDRVRIAVKTEGGAEREVPLVIGVLSDLLGTPREGAATPRGFEEVEIGTLGRFLAGVRPRIALAVPDPARDGQARPVELGFASLADFTPAAVAGRAGPGDREWLALILGHEEFRRIEAAWLGLRYLLERTAGIEGLRVRVLPIAKRDLVAGAGDDPDGHRSARLFRLVCEETYGLPGGEPFACLVGDFAFDHSPEDVRILSTVARIAAEAHAPFVAGAAPTLFGAGSWAEVAGLTAVAKALDGPRHAAWRALRREDSSRYVALTMPRLLLRAPAGDRLALHGNAAFALAANVARAHALKGWCARIRGPEAGGAVEGRPEHSPPPDGGWTNPAETALTERAEPDLVRCGLLPLVQARGQDLAVFFSTQTLFEPPLADGIAETATAILSSRLHCILPCCRFVHALKILVRDRLDSFRDRARMEEELNLWLSRFVEPDPAREPGPGRPLSAASVSLRDGPPGMEGVCEAIIALQPAFLLGGFLSPMLLRTFLPGIPGPEELLHTM